MFNLRDSEKTIQLPDELASNLLNYLDIKEQLQLSATSTFFLNHARASWNQLIALGFKLHLNYRTRSTRCNYGINKHGKNPCKPTCCNKTHYTQRD